NAQFVNGNNADGNQLQLDWGNANSLFGSVFAKIGSNDALPDNTTFIRPVSTPVASVIDPGVLAQGSSATFGSNSSLPDVTPGPNESITTTYAWDLNGDGLFTEFITEEPLTTFAWDDLVDFGFAAKGGGEYRVPLRVTRTFRTFDPATDLLPQVTSVQQSDSEVTVTVNDTAPVAIVNGGQAEANHAVRLGGAPFALPLNSDGNDPTGDAIVQWTVTWVDGEPSETIDAANLATHFYQRPGRYETIVTGLDENNKQTQQVTTHVNVTFDAASLDPGAAYAIKEGQGVVLQGAAAGSPASVIWLVNGNEAGAGVSQAFDAQTNSMTNRLSLSWSDLQALGVNNEGSFDVQLRAAYPNTVEPIASAATKLNVANVAPEGIFFNSGSIDQGGTATVGFRDVVEPNDTLVYSYDFGAGLETGNIQVTVPGSVPPGTRIIKGRISDGTVTQDYETPWVINDLPPSLRFDGGAPSAIEVLEGDTATLRGTYSNPGGGAVTFTTSAGSVAHDATSQTWTWTHTTSDNTNGIQVVTITVTDAEANPARLGFNLIVANAAPQATLVAPTDTKEGATGVAVELTEVTDKSAVDTSAGFRYSFDFGNDGSFEIGDGSYTGGVTSATGAVPTALLADSGEVPIRARLV
ncbi:MAG: hypothetical protein HYV60_06945, partial [Planctomycetia bacterium]|nr:hypothetical protein [Planctomycetia bacterium]